MEIEQQGGPGAWMEVKLGEFFCDYNTRDQQVKVTLVDPDNADQNKVKQKVGLIIGGIQFRPAV
jgi:Phloem protein 2